MTGIIILIVVLVLIGLFIVSNYNALIKAKNKVKDQFSQIDIQLKKRFDLIPNLVETVKGYTKHESETLEKIVNARNIYSNAKTDEEKVEASNELSKSLTHLFALAESYPELKANTNFIELQKDLKEVEDKISYARSFYNDAVRLYNNKVQTIPTNIIASLFGFKTESFFEAATEERQNVKVEF